MRSIIQMICNERIMRQIIIITIINYYNHDIHNCNRINYNWKINQIMIAFKLMLLIVGAIGGQISYY